MGHPASMFVSPRVGPAGGKRTGRLRVDYSMLPAPGYPGPSARPAEAGPQFRWRVVKVTIHWKQWLHTRSEWAAVGSPTRIQLGLSGHCTGQGPGMQRLRRPQLLDIQPKSGAVAAVHIPADCTRQALRFTPRKGEVLKPAAPERFPRTRWNIGSVMDVYRVFRLRKGESS